MIPIHELQIGSWVNYDKLSASVIGMGAYDVTVLIDGGVLQAFNYELIQPIPLTEEWLQRMGFKHDGGFWLDRGFWRIFPIKENRWRIHLIKHVDEHCNLREMQYVHQLQLFWAAVTGEKLEVKTINETNKI